MKKILITGGAGFIGSHLIGSLPGKEWEIVVLDALIPQVHGSRQWRPPKKVTFFHGNICNRKIVRKALDGVQYIVHLAAETGVGQSAYDIVRHVRTNELGTAVLLEEALKNRKNLQGIILASSRAIYGEGRYHCNNCGEVYPGQRTTADAANGDWEPKCPRCLKAAVALPGNETQIPAPVSVYAVTKLNQEHLFQQFYNLYGVPAAVVRLQNVYGPGQSLRNPYTGIVSIFSARALNSMEIPIYEDGQETRDFVYIKDAVRSIELLLRNIPSSFSVYNIGSGTRISVLEMAGILLDKLGVKAFPRITGEFRPGDIRHAWADTSKIEKELNFRAEISLDEGLEKFCRHILARPGDWRH